MIEGDRPQNGAEQGLWIKDADFVTFSLTEQTTLCRVL
jgi:hypothetical protein